MTFWNDLPETLIYTCQECNKKYKNNPTLCGLCDNGAWIHNFQCVSCRYDYYQVDQYNETCNACIEMKMIKLRNKFKRKKKLTKLLTFL